MAQDLYYEIYGEGETLVFLHGDTLDNRMWQPQVEYFKDRFQVLTYDMRGYGKSPIPTDHFFHYEDLKQLLKHLEIERAHVIGLSYGGEIAIDFTLNYPEMVYSLTLLDSAVSGFTCDVDWNIHPEIGLQQTKENWLNHTIFSSLKDKRQVKKLLTQIVHDYSGCHWNDEVYYQKLVPRAVERLHEIKVPIMVVTGDNDLTYFHRIADTLCEKIPQASRICIPQAGHMVNLEQPDFVNKFIESFIRSVYEQ